MRAVEVRRFARSLPEVTEQEHGRRPAFRSNKRVIVVFEPGEKDLVLYVDPEEREALLVEAPEAFAEITTRSGVQDQYIRVHLPKADADQLCELIEDAWRRFATKRAIAALEAGRPRSA